MLLKIYQISFCILLTCFLAVKSETLEENQKRIHEACTKQQGVSEERHSQFTLEKNDEDLMCYIKCLGTESKWMDENMDLNMDHIASDLDTIYLPIKADVLEMLKTCKTYDSGANLCEKAYNFLKCLYDINPKLVKVI